ncbi:phage terminase small subunit [uncultured Mediterranean phage uvMED]|nr:phage terminase small subunit [uncultured Mediterranean phage uvMED]BAQ90420.1 phage terminase small subunit [uncultured Mediterranean phage uvMED]
MEQKTPKKELKTTKKGGRKKIVLDLEQVENLASRGLGTTQIARALGVSWDTIDRNRKRSAEFEDALKRGKAKGLAQVTNSLFTSATDGNVTAQIFYLKNQDAKTWKDRQEVVTATVNLNDVLSGAKERLGHNTDEKKLKVINPLDTTSKDKSSLVNNQTNKKKR